MAQPKTKTFGQGVFRVGDGGSVEQFTTVCGFTSLSQTVNVETGTTNVPDCIDPDLPAWPEVDIISNTMLFDMSGVVAASEMDIWRDWILNSSAVNVQFFIDGPESEGGGTWEGVGKLTGHSLEGERGQRWQRTEQVTISGKPTWTPTP